MGCGNRCGTSHNDNCWLNTEPCGVLCGCIVYLLLGYGSYVVSFKIISEWVGILSLWGIFHFIGFNTCASLGVYSHWLAMTTDPGAVPQEARPLITDLQEQDPESQNKDVSMNKYRKWCKRCKAFKPVRAHHCSMCSRCIIKMDHHCPWVNNCVGLGNHKLFLLFLLWVFITCAWAMSLISLRYSLCMMHASTERCGNADSNVWVIFLFAESLLFGIFTACKMGDQSQVLYTNQTQIDRLKNVQHDFIQDYNEVFGCPQDLPFSIYWLLPFPAPLPPIGDKRRDLILGYCLDDEGDNGGSGIDSEMVPILSNNNMREKRLDNSVIYNIDDNYDNKNVIGLDLNSNNESNESIHSNNSQSSQSEVMIENNNRESSSSSSATDRHMIRKRNGADSN